MTRTRHPKKADPIFAVIKRLRRAELAIDAAGDDQSPKYDPLNEKVQDEFYAARQAFVTTVPTTKPAATAEKTIDRKTDMPDQWQGNAFE